MKCWVKSRVAVNIEQLTNVINFTLCGCVCVCVFLRALKILIPVTSMADVSESGMSPLHSAAAGGHPQCIKVFVCMCVCGEKRERAQEISARGHYLIICPHYGYHDLFSLQQISCCSCVVYNPL